MNHCVLKNTDSEDYSNDLNHCSEKNKTKVLTK